MSLEDEKRERLIEAARLSNIGRIAPSFAHQLSTPLAGIALRAESLTHAFGDTGRPADPERIQRYLLAIGSETERCKALLQALQAFARPPDPAPQTVDLALLCRQAVLLVQHEAMRRQVSVALDLADALPPLRGQAARLGQALLSLLLNAIAASPQGGSVRLVAGAEGGAARVSVIDEGDGPSEAARAALFEPFASTRPPDQGVGLGLMASRAVAEAHGGALAWDPSGARGCRFTLRLPLGGPGSVEDRDGRRA